MRISNVMRNQILTENVIDMNYHFATVLHSQSIMLIRTHIMKYLCICVQSFRANDSENQGHIKYCKFSQNIWYAGWPHRSIILWWLIPLLFSVSPVFFFTVFLSIIVLDRRPSVDWSSLSSWCIGDVCFIFCIQLIPINTSCSYIHTGSSCSC